jgi:hypothetical protein
VRVIFSTEPANGLLNHLTVVRELVRRGHVVTVAVHGKSADERLLEQLARDAPGVTIEYAAPVGSGPSARWRALAADVRSALDFLTFLDERFNDTYRARSSRRVPRPVLVLVPLLRHRPVRTLVRHALELLDRVIPADEELEAYLRSRAPDVVLFTPYVGLRTVQVHYLRAAKSLGLRTAICVKSWDNLTSKSALRPIPDRVFVWNEVQRQEAGELHGIEPERVVVTGAQCFDHWLTLRPRGREEFASAVGLDPGRPILVYTCCAPWTGQSEAAFVQRWLRAVRESDDAAVASAGVIVRPHPKRPSDVSMADLEGLGPVVVFPAHGTAPTGPEAQQDYFDTFFHAAAVVGLNTTAMLEAALLRRPVLTVLDAAYERLQTGTLHFRYMREVAGGVVDVVDTLELHAEHLGDALRNGDEWGARTDAFVREFLRPFGLDVQSTPIFVDEVERLARTPAPRPWRTPVPLLALRPLLSPLATRAARTIRSAA